MIDLFYGCLGAFGDYVLMYTYIQITTGFGQDDQREFPVGASHVPSIPPTHRNPDLSLATRLPQFDTEAQYPYSIAHVSIEAD